MLIGRILRSRYKIIRQLGKGGFGDTYLASDLDLPGNPYCVVKHLQPKNSNSQLLDIAQKLFDREAQSLYHLGKHNQIPTLYAHFSEDGQFYLVQEFIDGYDLTQEITSDVKLNEEETINLRISSKLGSRVETRI